MNFIRKLPLTFIFILIIVTIFSLHFICEKYFNFGSIEKYAPWITTTTAICALISANRVSEKWVEQHNKKLGNEFGLEVYKEFEKFENYITEYQTSLNNFYSKIPDIYYEHNKALRLDDKDLVKNNIDPKKLIEFTSSIDIQDSFNLLINRLRNYGLVTKTVGLNENLLEILKSFEEIFSKEEIEHHYYEELLIQLSNRLDKIIFLKDKIYKNYILNILSNLRA